MKRKGTYLLKYGPFSIDNKTDFKGKCSLSTYNISGYLNDEKSNNLFLLKQSPDEHFNTWIFGQFDWNGNKSGFAYKVE